MSDKRLKYIKPECTTFYYDDNRNRKQTKVGSVKGLATTSDDYVLPCCWCDSPKRREDLSKLGLLDDSLKLSNNQSVEDIIYSDQWEMFLTSIMHHPNQAPSVCKFRCGVYDD